MINVQSIELSPGKPDACLGSGEYEFECCCDECDFYLICFPDWQQFTTIDAYLKK